ncbi:hypothetical protein QUF81_10685 [Peribacillus simplex]|uniref:Uncharacterized protein n=1 Tax=Peribacillus simplex TaxID=1478 RepID=A0AAW7IF21_9BACI|nr:hypothetical protein [Peribacillus simplex]MDM5293644.1 hypothetical protein [Peribacillus simplex]MDM5452595.1 hypothetical protein [Peribacillus simplex]
MENGDGYLRAKKGWKTLRHFHSFNSVTYCRILVIGGSFIHLEDWSSGAWHSNLCTWELYVFSGKIER